MINRNFTFHSDDGHGWLAVTLSDLNNSGMHYTDFSRYSYTDGDHVYLEEDCDAPKFLNTFTAKHGEPIISERHVNGQSPIRDMAPYPHRRLDGAPS